MTGVRRVAGDRRRIRGAHVGLKRMLVEGMQVSSEKPYTWKDFSDAMIRQSVGEAMHSMPSRDAELLKLAYFGGLSNQDIADRFRLNEASVERRLRRALDAISDHVRRGRGFAEKVLAAIGVWFGGRWLADHASQLLPAGVAAAALIVVSQTGSPAHTHVTHAPALAAPAPAVEPMPSPTASGTISGVSGVPVVAPGAPAAVPELPSLSVPALPAAPAVGVPSLPAAPSVRLPRVKVAPAVQGATSTVADRL